MEKSPKDVSVPLDRDRFMRSLILDLASSLEEIVGVEESGGFVSLVGKKIGSELDGEYRKALGVARLGREDVGDVLVDIKRRIHGDFYIIEQDDEKIVLGNRACPFGDQVINRSSMCMMTSNVFGSVTAENLGYAKVVLEKTIARGDSGCRVVVYLKPSYAADGSEGRVYFKTGAA